MVFQRIVSIMAFVLSVHMLLAQQTTVYTEANASLKEGMQLYDKGVYGKAKSRFEHTIALLRPVNETQSRNTRMQAELYFAKCAVQMGLPDGEKLILDFIRNYSPDPIASQALMDLATYYYNDEQFEKAIEYYSKISLGSLNRKQKGEVYFRMGYAQFVTKKFAPAKNNFKSYLDDAKSDDPYYYDASYYLGLCHFFEGNYNEALRNLRASEISPRYRSQIPYYLCQIYFAERRYDELIAYAEPKLNDRTLKKDPEIRQLIGQSYFEKGNFDKALPYMEYYAERAKKLREEEFYQLGYTQYKMGQYSKAVRNLEQLSTQDSEIAQHAMYALGDCYLKLGNKSSARTAFAAAKRMAYDKNIQEESLYNYAKLSYELKDPREAITSLQTLKPGDRYYTEAQALMSEIFLNYRDYKQALEVLDGMPNRTPQLRETYQKVAYLRGVQLIQEKNLTEAKAMLERSLLDPVDGRTRATAIYWLGDIAHRQGDYANSIRLLTQFMTLAKTLSKLPDESSIFTANYTQGYNYLKQENFQGALGYFTEAANGIARNRSLISSEEVKEVVYGDALLRAGDCFFKRNAYPDAIKYYDQAIGQKVSGYVYAIYQKAVIEGLRGQTAEKILALERIPRDFPQNEFSDDALLELGATYQGINQLNRAQEPLRQLIKDYRNSALYNQALLRLGLIAYNLGNTEAATTYYKQIFSNNPTPDEANVALAALEEIYVRDLGRTDEYFAFLETIPGYKVDNMTRDSVGFRVAESQYEQGNYERAIAGFTDYIRKYPNGVSILQAYYHRGDSYAALKNYGEALRDYDAVIQRGNSRYYLKALEKAALIAYNYSQDFNKSYDYYTRLETAATDDNTRFEAQLGALRSAYRIGNAQAVNSTSQKVINNSRATQTQVATAHFYVGKMAFDQRNYDSALRSFNEVKRLSDNEQTAEARYLVAYIYYTKRDLDTASDLCIKANEESSAYPYWVAKSIILLSDVLAEQGDLLNAKAALEALLENYNEDQVLVNEAKDKLNRINQQLNRTSRLDNSSRSGVLELDRSGNN